MAKVTMEITGYYIVEVPDGDVNTIVAHGNEATESADFGELVDIEWDISSIEHDDGRYEEF